MFVGFLLYGCYGWRNSSEEYRMQGRVPPRQQDSKPDQDKNSNYFTQS